MFSSYGLWKHLQTTLLNVDEIKPFVFISTSFISSEQISKPPNYLPWPTTSSHTFFLKSDTLQSTFCFALLVIALLYTHILFSTSFIINLCNTGTYSFFSIKNMRGCKLLSSAVICSGICSGLGSMFSRHACSSKLNLNQWIHAEAQLWVLLYLCCYRISVQNISEIIAEAQVFFELYLEVFG